jgi:two-component system sensor histidine kinase RpfC
MDCLGLSDLDRLTDLDPAPDLWLIADHPAGADIKGLRAAVEARLGVARPCLFLAYAARRPAGGTDGCPSLGKPCLAEDLVAAVESLLGMAPPLRRTALESAGFGGATAQGSAGIRVLVAEDNVVAAKVITTFLGKMGFEYKLVHDGEEALREAVGGGYGIAIVDLRMPKLDGTELARRYRRAAPERRLPIVALTANASEEVKQECLAAGMDGFLAKPVSPEVLRETLERLAVRG